MKEGKVLVYLQALIRVKTQLVPNLSFVFGCVCVRKRERERVAREPVVIGSLVVESFNRPATSLASETNRLYSSVCFQRVQSQKAASSAVGRRLAGSVVAEQILELMITLSEWLMVGGARCEWRDGQRVKVEMSLAFHS